MTMSHWAGAVLAGALFFATTGAAAQDLGVTGGTTTTAPSRSGGVRIAVQGRIDALNVLLVETGGLGGFEVVSFMPLITGGVRIDRIFIGAGFGFYGFNETDCDSDACDAGMSTSYSGWSLSPMVMFDFLSDPAGAGYGLVSLTLANVGGSNIEDLMTGTEVEMEGIFAWGLNLGVGVRGKINEAIAIGTEWGWGFATWSDAMEDEDTNFAHGIFGSLMFEASVGL